MQRTPCHSLESNQSSTTNCDITTRNTIVPAADSGGGCVVLPHNELALFDSLALHTTNGSNASQLIVFPDFVLTCSDKSSRLLQGHAKKEVTGLAGFGFSKYSLPAQVSTSSSVFAVCLSGSPSAPGVAFFDLLKPYYFLLGIDVSNHLNYTPLFSHSVPSTTRKGNTKQPEDAYFIKVKSININSKPLSINQKLLSINKNGFGGTRISTTNPYTMLETSIFNTFIEAFANESKNMNLKLSTPAKPFSLCYEAGKLLETNVGPKVPQFDLLMENDVIWHVFGKNSMVRIVEEGMDVWCLAIVNGGD
uniref:Basic 7S globulin-like n=1 Tax=Tanacetum cinerariifolium TaxID=118510 RepID=A0A699IJ12_TANCI|nr:basic 7S globulin-like [Tanacetum cinerariifolium]